MSITIRKDEDPALWERLYQNWVGEKKRGFVVGPGGINYRAIPIDDDGVIFVAEHGVDGKYSETSSGMISK